MANDGPSDRRLHNAYGMLAPMIRQARPDRTRWALRSSALTLVGVMTLSGCVAGSKPGTDSSAKPSSDNSQGTKPGSSVPPAKSIQTRVLTIDPPLRVDVLSLGRAAGNSVKLRLRFTNTGTDVVNLYNLFTATQPGESDSMESLGGMTLIDGVNLKQYYPRLTSDGKCVCSNWPGTRLDGGKSFDSTILYPAPPQNVRSVDISAQRMPPFTGISIAGSSPNYPGDTDPSTAALRPPFITPLISTSDDLNGGKSIDDQGKSQDIRLSSDVLFKLNKADLSSKANAILKDVASRLDKASATTVKIDGYTDTSGNDAINNPLSRRRAESVKNALQKLVTRSGITYQTAGHGSQDPVASNDSEQGRKMNRRVTVSFEK